MRKTTKMAVTLAAMSVMVLGAATMVSAAEKNGWAKEGSDWYYYVEDNAVKNQWALSGDVWYFLGEDGKMETEAFIDNNIPEVVDEEDVEVVMANHDDYYYVDENGAMVVGWKKIEVQSEQGPTKGDTSPWYYFGANGIMYGDTWVQSGSKWYFIGENGRMLERELLSWDGNDYFLDGNGAMITGWYKTADKTGDKTAFGAKDKWVYADADGILKEDGWKKVNGSWYYFGNVSSDSVAPVSGSASGRTYVMKEETFISLVKNSDGDVDTFYLAKSGAMETGLFRIKGDYVSYYYFADSKGVLKNGVEKVSGKYYFFDTTDFVRYGDVDGENAEYVIKNADGSFGLLADTKDATAKLKATGGAKVYKLGTATMWD